MIQDIFIIGATGSVSSALIPQVLTKDGADRHKNPTRIVGVASRQKYLYHPEGLGAKDISMFQERKIGLSLDDHEILSGLEMVAGSIDLANHEQIVFVDCTGDRDITEFHKGIVRGGSFCVVTANKNPLAFSDYETFQELTQDVRRYGYKCSVMAGAEAVNILRDMRDLGDNILEIHGCLSGTNNYLLSMMEEGKKFSDVLRDAQKLGYTERDPRDDLSGLDVARKLTILVRSAGIPVNLEDVDVEPLLPNFEAAQEFSLNEFMKLSEIYNSEFETMFSTAKRNDKTIRFVARYKNRTMTVKPEQVPIRSELGSLVGTANKIIITSETYPQPYVITAPGAGTIITAQNIRGDLLDLLPNRRLRISNY